MSRKLVYVQKRYSISIFSFSNFLYKIINQVDADDFFEKELNDAPPVNPLLKPEVKPKNKELKVNKDGSKENLVKQLAPNEEDQSSPTNIGSTSSKALAFKKQKAQEAPNAQSGQDLKDSLPSVTKSLDLNSLLSQPTQSNMEKNAKSNQDLNERQVETAATSKTASGVKAEKRESQSPSDAFEMNELKTALKANEEALETYAIDNDRLVKERNELKELADIFQSKNTELDKNLTEILAKNTGLEEQVNKLNRELERVKKSVKASDIHVIEVLLLCDSNVG